MHSPAKPTLGSEFKIFDPRDPSAASGGSELLDASVVKRKEQWWMYLAGQADGHGATDIYSASLRAGVPVSAAGWTPTRDAAGELAPIAARSRSCGWDGKGGRHCPSYVKGWDPQKREWVERIYYAGAAENLWGPYTIGYLEWDGETWADQPEPAFVANEEWEHASVYEPNLIYHDGKWKMWYVSGSNHEDYLVHGYAESEDGRSGWSKHAVFAQPEMKMFDFCVRQRGDAFDAIFARVWVGGGEPPPETGLWWCRASVPSGTLSDWGRPIQIMSAEDRGWHSGPWKPSFQFHEQIEHRTFVGLRDPGKRAEAHVTRFGRRILHALQPAASQERTVADRYVDRRFAREEGVDQSGAPLHRQEWGRRRGGKHRTLAQRLGPHRRVLLECFQSNHVRLEG